MKNFNMQKMKMNKIVNYEKGKFLFYDINKYHFHFIFKIKSSKHAKQTDL